RERGMSGRDAAFATELGYGTLRRQGSLDAVLAACVDRPLDGVDAPVLDLLRLGAYQLLHLRVPAHAGVGETVALARAVAGPARAGFVNAVRRPVAAASCAVWCAVRARAESTARRALHPGHTRGPFRFSAVPRSGG